MTENTKYAIEAPNEYTYHTGIRPIKLGESLKTHPDFHNNMTDFDQTSNGVFYRLKQDLLNSVPDYLPDADVEDIVFASGNSRLLDSDYLEFFLESDDVPFSVTVEHLSKNGIWLSKIDGYEDDLPLEALKPSSTYTGLSRYMITFDDDRVFSMLVGVKYFVDAYAEARMLVLLAFDKQHLQRYSQLAIVLSQLEHPLFAYPDEVYIIGGVSNSFEPTVKWESIKHSDKLLSNIRNDIDGFFDKGVDIYRKLELNPFRKILLAGVPGTGKTMICNAIAKEKLDEGYAVIYVSGADRHEAQFWKISEALNAVNSTDKSAIIIVEELDAYMQNPSTKSQILNILDGSETWRFKQGVLLIATTNRPDAIDDRVLKRPGRLDRIYIVPEIQDESIAISFLKDFLGDYWHEELLSVAPKLLRRPGAFLREVCLYALTDMAYSGRDTLTIDDLLESLSTLTKQIDAKDDFLNRHNKRGIGLHPDD